MMKINQACFWYTVSIVTVRMIDGCLAAGLGEGRRSECSSSSLGFLSVEGRPYQQTQAGFPFYDRFVSFEVNRVYLRMIVLKQ